MLDSIDTKIIFILQRHGRRHLAEIAKEVDLSSPAVMERVKKLESRGIIKGYHALVDAKAVGKDIVAFVGVTVAHQKDIADFASRMVQESDVLECHHVTGDKSFILKVKTANTASLEKLLGEIHSMEGVTQTVTQVVLSTPKETQILEVDHEMDPDLACEAKRGENIQERKRVTETSRAK